MQKLKVKHLFFALGTGKERTSCKAFAWNTTRRCGDCAQNPSGSALLLVRFSPVDLLKNECGAWLKIRWVKGFLFASLSLSASGSPKEKEVRPECRGGRGCHGRVKIEVRADRYPSRTCGDET